MIIVNQAILHILDFRSGDMVFSDEPLSANDTIQMFLEKHIERLYKRQDLHPAVFAEDSAFLAQLQSYKKNDMTLAAFSRQIAERLQNELIHADNLESSGLIAADILMDDEPYFVLLHFTNHQGYLYEVRQTEQGVQNDIVTPYALLPGLTQKVEEAAFIHLPDHTIRVTSKRYAVEGERIDVLTDAILECQAAPSPKDAMTELAKITEAVAEAYGQDQVQKAAAMKKYVADNMESGDMLNVEEAAPVIFEESPAMQEDFRQAARDAGFTEPVQMDREATVKKVNRHKLKTDTGIELSIPTDYMDNTEFIEFNTNADGTLSITLKHIANIVNRK